MAVTLADTIATGSAEVPLVRLHAHLDSEHRSRISAFFGILSAKLLRCIFDVVQP